MKDLKVFFTLLIICIASLSLNKVYATSNEAAGLYNEFGNDSIEISLLTCSPGTEIYSLYGHTAIRYTDYKKGVDVAVNYGVFSFRQPFFILRFVFGLTDYEMGIVPFEYFYNEYKSDNRYVIQQVLNLTPEEKAAIVSAIETNYLPENRVYRYNYFYDNCTTRARDMIVGNIKGKVSFDGKHTDYPSFRDMIHSFNSNYPWAKFGKDLILSVNADMVTSRSEYQFLPFNLEKDFSHAVIEKADGSKRPLVAKSFKVIESMPQNAVQESFLRPMTCAIIILVITILVTLFELFLKKNLWLFDSFFMVVCGLAGLVLFLMIFSKHPTTSLNFQILLLNPLSLFFVYKVSKNLRQRREDKFWIYATIIIILFFVAGIFQKYAEGLCVLALSLLIRCLWRIIYLRSSNDK